MKNKENVIQNPLLCATQSDLCGKVAFIPSDGSSDSHTHIGHVEIEVEDFHALTLLDLLKRVKELLEQRVPDLAELTIDSMKLEKLKQDIELFSDPEELENEEDPSDEVDGDVTDEDESSADNAAAIVFSDESHVLDFWGLARASTRPLPSIIDTPMARLDATHRNHLVERYFPNASHQVIILSTDTEVDQDYYETLSPHLSHAYHLDYNEKKQFTEATEGYFWEAEAVGSLGAINRCL